VTAAPDVVAPTASSSVIGKSSGGEPGYVRTSGQYYVYATVSETGDPASGVKTVVADLVTSQGSLSVPLAAGSFPLFGTTYNYRSAVQTVPATFTNGQTADYTVTLVDNADNSRTTSTYTVAADTARPTATDVQMTNGGTVDKPDAGDRVTFTLTEPVDPQSVLSGWTGGSTNVVVRVIRNAPANDSLAVYNSSDTTQLQLGSVDLRRVGYVSATTRFGLTGTPSTMERIGNTIVVTLGTPSATTTALTTTASCVWTPSSLIVDRAGNAINNGSATETGTTDRDF
jgi:hypothetical protein